MDSRVTKGTLANGITYHLVTDSSSKGLADFALIQKGTSDPALARHNLSSLKSFGSVKPYTFLSRHGIAPDRTGYIRYDDDALVYNFHDIPMGSQAVVDSMVLMLFGIAETVPYEQDIVIAGDINAKTFQDKLSVMSMMVSKRGKAPSAKPYNWEPTESSQYMFRLQDASDESSVSVTYRSARPPKESMNTAQPIVALKFSHELGIILKSRLRREMYYRGIPVSGMDFKRRTSSDGPGDELYTFSVYTDTLYTAQVASVLASNLAYLDEHGANVEEYEDAKADIFSNASFLVHDTQGGNAAWVGKCIASYLYGADLASDQTITSFFTSKDIDSKTELGLFNNFVSALLDKKTNLILRCSSASADDNSAVKDAFESGWSNYRNSSYVTSFRINSADTLGLEDSFPKVKLKSTEPEAVSTGETWTFSNGMKVIFKQSKEMKGKFAYDLIVRGGYVGDQLFDIADSTHLANMLHLYDVAGLIGFDFRRMLNANGVVMNESVSTSGLSISGTAPSDKLRLLLKSLIAYSSDRSVNTEGFNYYRMCQALSDNAASLDDDFQARAEKYYTQQFGNMANGVLVIVGDMDAANLKKLLPKYLGGFNTESSRVVRTQAKDATSSGTTTIIKNLMDLPEGSVMGVNVKMTTPVSFTTERLMALRIAELAIRNAIVRETVRLGAYVGTSMSFSISPSEKFSVEISCQMAAYDGLPEGIVPADPLDVLLAVRRALIDVSSKNLSKDDLAAYKALLSNHMSSQDKDPRVIVSAVRTRLLDGKDVRTGYAARINAVTADMVREIMSSLNSSEKIEYVIR